MINIIATISNNRGLSLNGKKLFDIAEVSQLFELFTCGAMVIMSPEVWEAIGRTPLPNRHNVVLTFEPVTLDLHIYKEPSIFNPRKTELTYVGSEAELRKLIAENIEDDIWIIGGQGLFEMFVDEADKLVITEVDAEPEADRFFPMLDACKDYAVLTLMKGVWNGIKWRTKIYQDLEPWKKPLPKNQIDDPDCK